MIPVKIQEYQVILYYYNYQTTYIIIRISISSSKKNAKECRKKIEEWQFKLLILIQIFCADDMYISNIKYFNKIFFYVE